MENQEVAKALARRFIERANALEYKGKRRDNAALDYFCGAAVCAEESGNAPLANHLGRLAVLIVSVRGYAGVTDILAKDRQ